MDLLFSILKRQLAAGRDSMLVVITEAAGSLPRKAGAYMVADQEGRVFGTIGGGNLEYRATQTTQRLLQEKKGGCERYDLSDKGAADLGMVCGGWAKVLFYRLDAKAPETEELVRKGLDETARMRPCRLLLPLDGGSAKIEEVREKETRQGLLTINGQEYFSLPFGCEGRVYIFGGGHVAQATVPLLSQVGFRCVVADDREEFADPALFPKAEETIRMDFSRIGDFLQITEEDYIIIMTRGHLCDTEAERFALGSPACYIGVMGSRKKAKYVREKLEAEGFTGEQLDRVITPIGLPIEAETPEEIAVSIAGQLILHRSRMRHSR